MSGARVAATDGKRRRALVTPEGFDLGVTIGSAGARLAALTVDLGLLLLIVIAVLLLALFGVISLGFERGEPLMIGVMIAMFLLRNFWFIGFEAGKRAATPGKRLLGLRVVSRDGGALNVDQVIARNLMREIELFLPLTMLSFGGAGGGLDGWVVLFGLGWALLFTLFLLFNRDRMRVGDLLAGTWVIETGRQKLGEDLSAPQYDAHRFVFSRDQLSAYGVAELTRLEEVLRLKDEAQMWVVTDAIVGRIGWAEHVSDAEGFLSAYYAGLRGHLERDLLFGWKRADKHDNAAPGVASIG